MKGLLLILWFLISYSKLQNAKANSTVTRTPQLWLEKARVTPTSEISAGDAITMLVDISHTMKSFADAIDVELSVSCPPYIMFGSNDTRSLSSHNITKHQNAQFSNITLGTGVKVSMTTHVDPYKMLGSREKVTAMCTMTLWYYGAVDSCHRPGSKWNARSTSVDISFSFTSLAACEMEIQLYESYFSASSFRKLSYSTLGNAPHRANFDNDLVWTPSDTKDIHQYLQIELNHLMRITKVGTKGNGQQSSPRFVRKFVLHYSKDGREWAKAYAAFQSHEFTANNDPTTVKINVLKIPIEAKVIRIVPKLWKYEIALKVQLFGCLVSSLSAGYQPLGMSSGAIKDNKITAAPWKGLTYRPYHARLDFKEAWCTTKNWKQTLTIDLQDNYVIAEIAVQSKYQTTDRLYEAFKVSYEKNGGTKEYIRENGGVKSFLGSPIEDTTIRHKFLEPILARHVHIEPKLIANTVCLRLELYGFKEGEDFLSDHCTIFDFEDDYSLTQWKKTGTAFDYQPTFLDNLHARTGLTVNHEGARWIGTRENRKNPRDIPGDIQGNSPTGTLTSPPFIIPASKLYFLFAGSADQEKSRVELLIEGRVERTSFSATGNESMSQMSWNVRDLLGEKAQIRLVDSGSDAFVSFDGLKSSCHVPKESLPVFERSFLLNRLNNTLYMCHFSHESNREDAVCRLTFDNGKTWQDLSNVAGLLGISETTGELYGVSMDRRHRLVNKNGMGRGAWNEMGESEWDKVKDSLHKVVEIPNIPVTGLLETDQRQALLTMTANSGDSFSASSLGVYHRPSSGSWTMIATWLCKEYPDICVSSPCDNSGVCHANSDGSFNCTCPLGFSGDVCDQEIDDCKNDSCLNGGQCIDGFNTFYCVCNSFYTGEKCEKNIDDCALSSCSAGAVCIDGLGNFTCQCPSGFAGEFCQLEIDECASLPCQHDGRCVDEVNSYTCYCRQGYSGINCETVHAAVSGFEVLSTQSVLYESSRYTVVHARLPPGGRSRHQTWCHDYTELCYSLNKTRPTGCGRSSNHITEMHQCQTLYDSVMSHNNTLDCPPNVKVSSLAKMAGYSNASPENSFAFSKCGSSECTDALPTSGCHGALSCISQANSEVYTVCADPDSNFMVKSKGYATNKGVSYLSLYVKPLNTSSRHENWCRDYQRLCESYGKRPTGCGNASTECRDKYFSITPKENELDCENNTKVVARISQTAGMPSNTETLNFHICGENKCKKDFPACWAETCLEFNNYNVLCTEPLTGFSVLEERWTLSDNISFLVIKAKLARDRMSTQENWCQDYSTLCKSYGLRPTGRDVIQDYEYTSCRDKYGSIMTDGVFFGSKPQSKIASIAQQAGFSAANEDNSFGLDKCTLCSSVLTKSKCAGLGCMNPSHHNDVYTVCMKKHASEFDILEREKTVYKNTAYLAVKAKVTGIKKWAENYNKTCSQYGRRNVVCKENASEIACNKSEVLIIFSKHTLFTNATTSNIYIPGVHTPTSDVAYMLCEGPDSNFDVISTKPVSLGGQEYLIIEARLPSNGVARYENWCEDYKQLCLSYGQRPVCCKTETGISSHTACRDNYDALFPGNSQSICPSNAENATLANRTAYFTFSFCNESTCSKNNAIALDASMKTTNTVYALCLASNTSFAVQSSMNVSYQGSTYKIIKARIPLHQTSKQDTWCHDYQTLCNSYGWRAVVTSKDADGSCQRSYEAITPQRHELSTNEKLEHLVKLAGFENAIVGNIFGFGKSCKNSCYASISDSSQVAEPAINLNSSLMSQKNNVIYAVCVNSDTNFHVLDNRRTNYENRSYLVLKTRIPSHGVSKYKSWCLDYQRLCGEYEMRPVSFLSRESQIGSHDMDTYIPHFISVVVFPKNESLKLITREYISIVANLAGYREASRDNSFAFSEHNPGSCSWRLGSKCASSIDCLNIDARELYTVCTDSNSNFLTEDTRHIKYKGLPYLLVRSRVPEDGVARHQTWCSDYKNLCNSFGMQPVICEKQEGCAEDFDFANSSCQLGNITVLKGLVDEQFVKNSSGFMLKGCDKCEKTLEKTCTDQSICSKDAKTTLVPCTKLRHNFRIFESKQINYENVRLSIVKAKITSNTSFYQDWGYDYKKMCSLLGKRPFSCHELGNVIQYKNRKQYNIFLSELKNCSDMEKLQSLAVQAGFSQAKNILFFESSQTTSNELVSQYISGDLTEPSPTKCCKCPNSSANSTDCCLCKKVDPVFQIHLSKCPHGKTCTSFNASEDIYAVCSDFSPTNFDVEDAREVLYADQQYTVVKAQIPPHGQSRSETWCEDYKMLCQAVGKRPVACGRNFDTLKRSRDCRVHYNAIMMQEMSCPGSDEITTIARHAGFSANVNETLGLWNCETCSKNLGENWNIEASSKNLSEVWNIPFSPEGTNETFYIGNTPFTVYLLCSQSESNFNVLEERKVDHAGSPVSVLMTTIPHHGESLNENWCIDYTQLCQSYGSRPIGCGSSADNIEEHAQCRDGYNALMYSKDNIHCQDELKIHEIAKSAGFIEATKQNSFIFKSCLPQQCTKFLPSAEHPFTKFEANLSDGVFYTLCGSSDSAYEVIATRPITVEKQDYLVIRTRIPVEGLSKHVTWCEDYEKLCEAYGMKPLTCKINSHTQRECIYNFGAISLTNADLACPAKTGVASIAKQVGFDNVTNTNSFAMERCDRSKSCVNKMPNIKCKDTTHYDVSYETKKTQVRMTRADYILNVSKTILNVALNKTQTIIVPEDMHCFIIPSPPSGQPVYKIDGEKLTDIFKSNTCVWNFDPTKPGVTLSYFNLTVNQTFEHRTPRVETNCWLDSSSSLARMSGEANTVCIRPASDTSFRVKSSRKVSKAGREYLIIQAKVLSPESKSSNWCKEYSNLCKAFQTSPLACPRRFGFHKNYDKCITSYGGIMMSEVNYQCPSNGFVSELARTAGYGDSSLANSFSLVDCNDVKCKKVLPATGCSDGVHCLSQEVLHDHVYTACVVANSDSNFNVIETIEKTLSGYDYTVIRARRPANGAPLFQTWCKDYQRLCESLNLRPVFCNNGLSADEYLTCKLKYNSVLSYGYGCPTGVMNMARHAGFSEAGSKNSFAFYKCSMCSGSSLSSKCDQSLHCLTTAHHLREVYTICGGTKTQSSFKPLVTKEIRYDSLRLRVIQAKVIKRSAATSDWGVDYKNLCGFYDELPTGCGVTPGESRPGVDDCKSKYSSHLLRGNELGCNPNDVISKLARDAGFVNARPSNSFGFSYCNGSSVSELLSTCHRSLPCLTWSPDNPIVYTVCVRKPTESNFKVLATKSVNFNNMEYLVIHAEIPEDGKSYKSDWCHDYRELCVSYNMLPTGCGGSNVEHSNYSSCSTQYSSYMPENDILRCGDTTVVIGIANKAGFKDAISRNTFVFQNCHQCTKDLTSECNGALNCLTKIAWRRQVYTVCVKPTTAFNVRSTKVTVLNSTNYLIIEAKLPNDGRAKSVSWCQEYKDLCKSYNKRPLACQNNYQECTRKYAAEDFKFSCDTKTISNIALQAGYSKADQSNTFILKNCESCSKKLASSGCDASLSCVNSNPTDYVYAICTDETLNFKIMDSQKISISGDVYTVVSALQPERKSSTWCRDYTELCHAIGQSPVALHSGVVTESLLQCRDEHDAVIQKSEFDVIHHIAQQAGYNEAAYGNTFAFKDCSQESCQSSPFSYNCSDSLHCLNSESRKIHGLCVENTPTSNFYVLENNTVISNDTMYAVVKVRIPEHRLSRFESWCRDYERLCHAHNLRPLTDQSHRECSIEYFSIYDPERSNALSLLNLVHLAGFQNATTNDIYSLRACSSQDCSRVFKTPHCESCSTNQRRVFYAICVSLDEEVKTNFETQQVRNVWLEASFLVAQVKIPLHKQSKTENWCQEYKMFCKSYSRQPYASRQISTKLDACSWKYNATTYDRVILPGSIVERAGFNVSSSGCVSGLHDCAYCGTQLDRVKCPFENCQAALDMCQDFYIICT